jgi:hypothetical protein
VIDSHAFVAGLADVTDRGAGQEEEIERRLEVEVPAPAENTLFGFKNARPRIFRQNEAAIGAREIALRPFEPEATPRVADRAGDENFPLNP